MNSASENFDAYHKWLGIAPKDQPPNHYRLLGIDLFESDPDVISGAAEQRMAYVRSFQSGAHADLCERILDEIVAARVCLLRADLKAAYDGSLRQQMKVAAAPSSDFIPPVGTSTTRRMSSQTWKLQSMILVGVGAAIGSLVVGLILLTGNSKMPPAGQVPKPEIVETKTATPVQTSPASPVAAKATSATASSQQAEQQNPSLPTTVTPPDRVDTPPLAVAPFGPEKARSYQEQWAKHVGVPLEQVNSIGMKLVFIPPGEFFMGSPTTEQGRRKDEYQHRVRITKPFCLGACEVTQAEYERVVGKNPSDFSKSGKQAEKVDGMDTSRFPVEQVSWEDAVEFCRRLSALPAEKAAGRVYRLPTEAEWEYACRAGTAGRFCFGDDVTAFGQYAWYEDNSDKRPHPVGEKKPNGWGLHDIHGSVFEWCQDWYDEGYYEKSPMDDPVGPSTGERRVLRGTCWHCYPQRCADRQAVLPSGRCNFWGFRVVCMQ